MDDILAGLRITPVQTAAPQQTPDDSQALRPHDVDLLHTITSLLHGSSGGSVAKGASEAAPAAAAGMGGLVKTLASIFA